MEITVGQALYSFHTPNFYGNSSSLWVLKLWIHSCLCRKLSLLQTVIQQKNYKIPWDYHNLLSQPHPTRQNESIRQVTFCFEAQIFQGCFSVIDLCTNLILITAVSKPSSPLSGNYFPSLLVQCGSVISAKGPAAHGLGKWSEIAGLCKKLVTTATPNQTPESKHKPAVTCSSWLDFAAARPDRIANTKASVRKMKSQYGFQWVCSWNSCFKIFIRHSQFTSYRTFSQSRCQNLWTDIGGCLLF